MFTRKIKSVAIAGVLFFGFNVGAAEKVTFEDHILPIFRNSCLKCHNADKMRADLDISTYAALINGSGNGEIVAGGDPDSSLLYTVVTHEEEPTMPPNGKLSDKDIATIKAWIAGGLLENSGSKAVMSNKPKVNLALDPDSLGKRPDGPPPMPVEVFSLDPYVRTARTSISTAMAVSPWSPLIAIGGQRQVLLYNTDSLTIAGIVPYEEGYPHSLKFSSNGKLLVIGGGRGANIGHSTVWDITKGEKILQVGDDLDAVMASDISPDQRFIAHGGPDRLLRIFSTETGEVVHKIKKHTDWVTAVRFSIDGKYVASGDRNGGLHVWETEPGGRVCSFNHGNRVVGFEWASTNIVVSASMDGTAKIFNVDEARQLKSWSAHSGGTSSIARSMNGMLVTSGRNKRATLWDANGVAKRSFTFPDDIPAQAVPSHDAKLVIGSDWEGTVYVWNAADGKEVKRLSLNPVPMAEQFAAAEKAVTTKAAEAKAAITAHKVVVDRIANAKADMNALDAVLAMRQKAVTDSKTSLDKLVAEKQKPTQAKVAAAAAALKKAGEAKAAAQKTFDSAAEESGKATAKKKVDEAVKVLAAATVDKTTADKALSAINTQVAQLTTVHSAANKALTDAQNKAKAGKAAITKQITDLGKAASVAQAKVTTAGAALTTAQEEVDILRVNKTFAALYNVRKEISVQEAKLEEMVAAAESAQAAAKAVQAEFDKVKETDINVLKAGKLEALKKAQQVSADAESALERVQAEIAAENVKVVAAQKMVDEADTQIKKATDNLEVAKQAKQKAEIAMKAEAEKVTVAQKRYDQLAASKLVPLQTIAAALDKAKTQSSVAKANAAKAVQSIEQEIIILKKEVDSAAAKAKSASELAIKAKALLDQLAVVLTESKKEVASKIKSEMDAKAGHQQHLEKMKIATDMAVKADAAFKKAPVVKVAADSVLKTVNAEVKVALNAFTAAEMSAQSAEMTAGNDEAKQAEAKKLREAADSAKSKLDDLMVKKQKPALAKVDEANQSIIITSKAKAAADTTLASSKAAVAQALNAFNLATKAREAAQVAEKIANDKYVPAKTAHDKAAATAAAKQSAATQSKNLLATTISNKQKPALEAVAAAEATLKELNTAKTASIPVMKQVVAEMAVAIKPVEAAKAVAAKANEAVKESISNEIKMNELVAAAQKVATDRKKAVAAMRANVARITEEKVKPMEGALKRANGAMTVAQAAYDNAEKVHKARLSALAKDLESQSADATAKKAEADKFASAVAGTRKQLELLEAEYQKLKSAATPKKEPTKTASK